MSDRCRYCGGEMYWRSNSAQDCKACGSWWGVFSGWHKPDSVHPKPDIDERTEDLLNHMADLLRKAWEDTEAAHGRCGWTFYEWLEYLERAIEIEAQP